MEDIKAWWQEKQRSVATRDVTKFIGQFKIPSDERIARATDRKVDLVVAGTQKGGTTALDGYLRLNREICMPNRTKEVHFFDTDKLFVSGDPDYPLVSRVFQAERGAPPAR